MAQLFKLEGQSLEAFENFESIRLARRQSASKDSSFQKDTILNIPIRMFSEFKQATNLDVFVTKKINNCLTQLGYDNPVISVTEYSNNLCDPRAYQVFPEIFIVINNKDEADIYMRSPIGYDGKFFTPKDGQLVDKTEQERLEDKWFNPRLDYAPAIQKRNQGIALPNDYQATGTQECLGNAITHGTCFLIEGTALETPHQYLKDIETYNTAIKTYDASTKAIVEKIQDIMLQDRSKDHKLNLHRENGSFYLSLWHAKKDVIKKLDCPDIILERVKDECYGGRFKVIAGNSETSAGKSLQALLDKIIDKRPIPNDYEELNLGNAHFMRHDQYGDRHYMTYDFKNNQVPENIKLPSGFKEVDLKELNWLIETKYDLEMNVLPPPPPEHLSYLEPTLEKMADKTKPKTSTINKEKSYTP